MAAKNKQQNFIEGSVVLVTATFIVKILGAVYRIFLTNLIGSDGMGFYSTAYDIYLPIYSIAMAGLPIAISKIVAENVAAQRYRQVRQTMRVAKRAFFVTGGVGFVMMVVLAFIYANLILKDSYTLLPILAISPCLLFCCIMSAYRGYYEGLRDMRPTAVSQVIEALGKLVFGYVFSLILVKIFGSDSRNSLSIAACGALLGIVLGTVFASGYLILRYRKQGDGFTEKQLELSAPAESGRRTLKMLMAVAVPVVLAALVSNITSLIDVTMVKYQLRHVIENHPDAIRQQFAAVLATDEVAQDVRGAASVSEFAAGFANSLYGMHRGYAYSIYNLVPVITSVLGVSAIPTLATAWANRNGKEIRSNMETIIRTTALIAMPLGAGIVAISWAILNLLYGSSAPETIEIVQYNLRVLGVCAIFCGLDMPMTNMLQAIGKQKIPLLTMSIGAVIKIVTNLILVSNPDINIYGVPYGTTLCYVFIFVADLAFLIHYSKQKINLISTLGKPLIAAAVSAVSAYAGFRLCVNWTQNRLILVVIPIIAAALFYVILLGVTNAISENDIKMFPHGKRIAKVLAKIRFIR